MADLTVTVSKVGMIDPEDSEVITLLAAVAITKGQGVYQNSSGKAALVDGSSAGTAQFRGVALETVGAGTAVSILKRGKCDGFTLSGVAYDGRVYVSDIAGALADAAGTVSVVVGRVVGLTDSVVTKVLYVDADYRTQAS